MFNVYPPDKERWIFISSDNSDDIDDFVILVKAYCDKLKGKIVEVSESIQYRIDNDELGLIFQWDGCFGITVVVPYSTELNTAYDVLTKLCKIL